MTSIPDRVLDHYEQPHGRGSLSGASHRHTERNPVCGDSITVELQVVNGRAEAMKWDGEGCCICQAAASMLAEQVQKWIDQTTEFESMKAADMLELFGEPLTARRVQCCLLAWKALKQAIYSPVEEQA